MAHRLDGKVALVTGATSGIGLAIAKRFVDEGARVFVTGRRASELEKAVAALGRAAIGVQGDATRTADLDTLFTRIRNETGRLDIVVANAGGGSMLPLGEITEQQIDETFARNVKAVVLTVQKALPLLTGGGSVILIGSTAGIEGTAAFSIYSASKAAVRALARSWALDLKGRNIRVNVLSPGSTRTPGLVDLAGPGEAQRQGLLDYLASRVPLGRIGEPDEIAKAALFLATDDSSFVNGAELFADGGQAQV